MHAADLSAFWAVPPLPQRQACELPPPSPSTRSPGEGTAQPVLKINMCVKPLVARGRAHRRRSARPHGRRGGRAVPGALSLSLTRTATTKAFQRAGRAPGLRGACSRLRPGRTRPCFTPRCAGRRSDAAPSNNSPLPRLGLPYFDLAMLSNSCLQSVYPIPTPTPAPRPRTDVRAEGVPACMGSREGGCGCTV